MLPPPYPPPSSRLAGCPAARATWGDVCSLARRISSFDDAGACMKPDLVPCSEFLSLLLARPHRAYRDDMGFNGKQENFVGLIAPIRSRFCRIPVILAPKHDTLRNYLQSTLYVVAIIHPTYSQKSSQLAELFKDIGDTEGIQACIVAKFFTNMLSNRSFTTAIQ